MLARNGKDLCFQVMTRNKFLGRTLTCRLRNLAISSSGCLEDLGSNERMRLCPRGRGTCHTVVGNFRRRHVNAIIRTAKAKGSCLLTHCVSSRTARQVYMFTPGIAVLRRVGGTMNFASPCVYCQAFRSLVCCQGGSGRLGTSRVLVSRFRRFNTRV